MYWQVEELKGLRDQFNQLVEEAYGRKPMNDRRMAESGTAFVPPVEAWETEKEICLSLDLPGLNPEDMDVQIEGEELVIKGERKPTDDKRSYRRKEKLYGQFYRAFRLTTPVEREKVTASYKNGVLDISIPKTEEIKPKQIKINVEE